MSDAIAVGKAVPELALPCTEDENLMLSDLRGRNVVLYFYPKDNTPGCTTEGQDFRDHYDEFRRHKTEILGISRDSLKSHEGFRRKHSLPFDLVSDAEEKLCRRFAVLKEKTLYGRKVIGIERSTFLIDREGVLRREFRGVKVDGHVQHVLDEIKKL